MTAPNQSEGGGLFRERAVSAIDSVEHFDEAIAIVSSRSIFALSAIGVLLIFVMLWAIAGRIPIGLQGRGVVIAGSGVQPVVASAEGTLIALPGQVGDVVSQGAAIARMRTTSGDIVALRAPASGRLAQRSPQLGSFVRSGDAIAAIEPLSAVPAAVVFVPVETDLRVAVGMPVRLSPADARPDVFGYLRGHVTYAAPFPASPDRIRAALENDAVASSFSPETPVREVHVALDTDSQGSLIWSGLQNARRSLS
ncbi:MAG: HlyD family efflux transporter periplasmic adaptor subunit, partial [Candidatus Eremiobacteraeota bacterium]|nr:HlyD family efflux transporter periplasmic adaptor subunit [Candidatus Eremiobacteraeota bacterium]